MVQASANSLNKQGRLAQTSAERLDVVFVSIFGRGNWLAFELASRGWKVALIDLSAKFKSVDPVDVEGPLGLLADPTLRPSQMTRMLEDGESAQIAGGFSLLLPEGPLECSGELSQFLMGSHAIPAVVQKYLRAVSQGEKDLETPRRALLGLQFKDSWLAHFAHSIASNVNVESQESLGHGQAWPILAPLILRHASSADRQQSLTHLKAAQVEVIDHLEIAEIDVSGRTVDSITLADGRRLAARAFMWSLSSQETAAACGPLKDRLFPAGTVQPSWYWTRTRFKTSAPDFAGSLPQFTVIVSDRDLPWTGDNALVVKRVRTSNECDVWMRLPLWMKSDPVQLAQVLTTIEKVLNRRFPEAQISVSSTQTESPQSASKIPPSNNALRESEIPILWGLYETGELGKLRTLKSSNWFFDGPEHWAGVDRLSQSRFNSGILTRLEKMKLDWEAAARKAAKKAAAKMRSASP